MPIQPLKNIRVEDRIPYIFVEKAELNVQDGAFVAVDKNGIRVQIPLGDITVILLETGTTITHEAVKLARNTNTLIMWVGDGLTRVYSCGNPSCGNLEKILLQTNLFYNKKTRLDVVRNMYKFRFNEDFPKNRSIEQLRGLEGSRVRKIYSDFSKKYNVKWEKRKYKYEKDEIKDEIGVAISVANSCLYAICEAAILINGYLPSIGYIHTGNCKSFVYDIADLYKFEKVIPFAFEIVSSNSKEIERDVRIRCRDFFKKTKILKNIINDINNILVVDSFKVKDIEKIIPIMYEDE